MLEVLLHSMIHHVGLLVKAPPTNITNKWLLPCMNALMSSAVWCAGKMFCTELAFVPPWIRWLWKLVAVSWGKAAWLQVCKERKKWISVSKNYLIYIVTSFVQGNAPFAKVTCVMIFTRKWFTIIKTLFFKYSICFNMKIQKST